MRTINATFKQEKNKEGNKPIFLYTVYDYNGAGSNLYFAEYDTDIVFDGITYQRFPITHEPIGENTQGEINTLRVIISNISRLIQAYLEQYDFRGKKVSIKLVWANQLADTDAYIEDAGYIDSYTADQENVSFLISSKFDVLGVELPLRRYSRNYCSWEFKSTECGYSGSETSCDKTLQRCKALGNQVRYGGFPAVPTRRIYV